MLGRPVRRPEGHRPAQGINRFRRGAVAAEQGAEAALLRLSVGIDRDGVAQHGDGFSRLILLLVQVGEVRQQATDFGFLALAHVFGGGRRGLDRLPPGFERGGGSIQIALRQMMARDGSPRRRGARLLLGGAHEVFVGGLALRRGGLDLAQDDVGFRRGGRIGLDRQDVLGGFAGASGIAATELGAGQAQAGSDALGFVGQRGAEVRRGLVSGAGVEQGVAQQHAGIDAVRRDSHGFERGGAGRSPIAFVAGPLGLQQMRLRLGAGGADGAREQSRGQAHVAELTGEPRSRRQRAGGYRQIEADVVERFERCIAVVEGRMALSGQDGGVRIVVHVGAD